MGIDSLIKKVCVQTAVYWGPGVPDGYGGRTFDAPVELEPPTNGVRWDEKVQMITDVNGKEIVSKAEILIVQDVETQGWLMLGTLDDIASDEDENDPKTVTGAYEIKRFDKTPMVMSTDEFVRKAYL
jgi:hypothetical protein